MTTAEFITLLNSKYGAAKSKKNQADSRIANVGLPLYNELFVRLEWLGQSPTP